VAFVYGPEGMWRAPLDGVRFDWNLFAEYADSRRPHNPTALEAAAALTLQTVRA
jgi:hypothetical protein